MTVLEICVDSVASSLAAQAGGADRLELCANLVEGGVTPAMGLVRTVLRHVQLPVHAMVRPRGGDFLYSAAEQEVMREDVLALKSAGVHGLVLGCLAADGGIDEGLLRELVSLASPLPVTFHRAIDVSRDPCKAVRACVRCGVQRILSSGGAVEALEGAGMLRMMLEAAGGKCALAAGGGVTEANAAAIVAASGADEIHGSLRGLVPSAMGYRPARPIPMGAEKRNEPDTEFETRQTVTDRVAAVVRALRDGGKGIAPTVIADLPDSAIVQPPVPCVLIGDIGGTNIRLAAIASDTVGELRNRPQALHSSRYETVGFATLQDALWRFQAEVHGLSARVVACALSVCGPVVEGVATCLAESSAQHLESSFHLSPHHSSKLAVSLLTPSHRSLAQWVLMAGN